MNTTIQQLTDALDLMRDEFRRISVCPGCTDEIKGLCDRAKTNLVQKVPVIAQRDEAERTVARLRGALHELSTTSWTDTQDGETDDLKCYHAWVKRTAAAALAQP